MVTKSDGLTNTGGKHRALIHLPHNGSQLAQEDDYLVLNTSNRYQSAEAAMKEQVSGHS